MMTGGVRKGLLLKIDTNFLSNKLETITTRGLLIAEHQFTSLTYLMACVWYVVAKVVQDIPGTIGYQLEFLFRPSKRAHNHKRNLYGMYLRFV